MAKSNGVDTGVLVYVGFINTLIESLKHSENKKLIQKKISILKIPLEEKYKIQIDKNTSDLLEVKGPVPAQAREDFYVLFLDVIGALEARYGIEKTWKSLKPKLHPVYAQHQNDIIEFGLEVPLIRSELEFLVKSAISKSWIGQMFSGLVGGQKWAKGVALVTNERLLVLSKGGRQEISISDVLTVGREVYSDVNLKYSRRSVKLIDYKTSLGIGALLYEGPPENIREFNKIISRARVEAKGLTATEKKILITLDRRQPLTSLLAHGDVSKKTLAKALARLRQIDYITSEYELTSYGINSLTGIMQQIHL